MRVHELAKELKLDSKQVIAHLDARGIAVKSHMSTLTDEQADAVRGLMAGAPAKKPPTPAARSMKAPASTPAEAPGPAPVRETVEIPADGTVAKKVIEQRVSGTVIRRRKKELIPDEVPADHSAAAVEPAAEQAVPEAEAPPADEAPVIQELPAENADEESASGELPPDEPAEAKPQIKKLNLWTKEGTPARIIDRIDLGTRREPQPAESTAGDALAVETPPDAPTKEAGTAPAGDKEDRSVAKLKAKRKKFHWQRDVVDEEEASTEAAPARHKRVRYKVKEKAGGRSKKADSIQLISKETEKTVPKAIKRKIKLQQGITVADLARRMGVKATELIKRLFDLGVMTTINQTLESDTAALVAGDYGYEIETVSVEEEVIFEQQAEDAQEDLRSRCPVVTVMGHVDHGKTSLLDAIRKTDVVAGEKGGITQHIGAYRVSMPGGDIAFVDTPGHEAFTTMRARGTQVTDIVILVVAAEEGVKPQTVEAIDHARAAEVPLIVAVNKIDKPEANPEKVRQELSQYGLLSEEWGGETIFVDISAKNKIGIEKLLEMVLLQSEMLELKANPDKPAKGTIIEARLDRGRGAIATVLVQEGTLRPGDSFVSKQNFGKVRALLDDRGRKVKEAGPSTPVEVLGFSSVPEAGDVFIVVDEKTARQTSDYWQHKRRGEDLRKDVRINLENFFSQMGQEDVKELCLVLKSDVQGSAEAIRQSLDNLSTEEVKVHVIHNSVGAVSLNDVMLASASNAIIIGFNVKAEPKVLETADQETIDVRFYSIIYEVIDDVKKAMIGMLAPRFKEKPEGKAEIRQVFDISKMGTVAGCFVIEGKMLNGSKARVLRGADVVHEGEITSLKRFKEDAREVQSGQDCGIFLGAFKDFSVGDIIESFVLEKVERTL